MCLCSLRFLAEKEEEGFQLRKGECGQYRKSKEGQINTKLSDKSSKNHSILYSPKIICEAYE